MFKQLIHSIKQGVPAQQEDFHEQLLFKVRLMALFLHGLLSAASPFLNPYYPFWLGATALVIQTIALRRLLAHKNIYITAIICQLAFLIPLFYISFDVHCAMRLPLLSLAIYILYFLQFYPFIISLIFAFN